MISVALAVLIGAAALASWRTTPWSAMAQRNLPLSLGADFACLTLLLVPPTRAIGCVATMGLVVGSHTAAGFLGEGTANDCSCFGYRPGQDPRRRAAAKFAVLAGAAVQLAVWPLPASVGRLTVEATVAIVVALGVALLQPQLLGMTSETDTHDRISTARARLAEDPNFSELAHLVLDQRPAAVDDRGSHVRFLFDAWIDRPAVIEAVVSRRKIIIGLAAGHESLGGPNRSLTSGL